MPPTPHILRYAAFTTDPAGGNPAGIVLDAAGLADSELQAIATDVGFAETAFVVESAVGSDARHVRLRFFSPLAEVPFCGHATIATATVLAERDGAGPFTFDTPVGPIAIETTLTEGVHSASFTSMPPQVTDFGDGVLADLLELLGVGDSDLDPRYPPRIAFSGNRHPVLVFSSRATFDGFTFDPGALRRFMDDQGWPATVTTAFAVSATEFDTRNLFPVGPIVEDPATGSAAAALGGYLRLLGLVTAPARVIVHQGSHVGRPSVLTVDVPATGGIIVSGTAVAML